MLTGRLFCWSNCKSVFHLFLEYGEEELKIYVGNSGIVLSLIMSFLLISIYVGSALDADFDGISSWCITLTFLEYIDIF